MATITFPSNPVLNQIYSYDGNTWIWDGSSWQLLTNAALNAVVIGNVVPETGAFTDLTANTVTANTVTSGLINASTLAANTVIAGAFQGTSLSLSGNIISAVRVQGPVTATGFNTVGAITTSAGITSLGNVSAPYFIGDGSLLTNLPVGNGSNYSNANVASYLPTYTGNLQAGNVSVLGNIFGNGISVLGRVVASGNITGGNISTSGNVVGAYLFGDARYLINVPGSNYSNANVGAYLPTYSGNLNAANYSGNGAGLTGITGANVTGAVANAAYAAVAGTAISVPAANIVGIVANAETAALAGAALIVPGSGVSGPVAVASTAIVATTANTALSVSAANVVGTVANAAYATTAGAATTAGTVTTAAQPNITSVGTLSSLTVSGTVTTNTVTANNLNLNNNLAIAGNVTATRFIGDGSGLTGLPTLNYSNANVAAYLPTYTGVLGSSSVTSTGNIVGVNVNATNQVNAATVTATTLSATGNVRAGNVSVTGALTTDGNITGRYLFGDARYLANIPQTYTDANVAAFLPNYNGELRGNTLSVVGNATVSNLYVYGDEFATQNIVAFGNVDASRVVANAVSSTGNVTATYYFGDGRFLSNLPTGNYSNANVAAFLPTYTGNLAGTNLSVQNVNTGTVSATGNVRGSNVVATGNVSGVNIAATGSITSAGNITGQYIFGDGRFLSNIPGGNYSNANVAAYLPTYAGALVGANLSVTGNVNSGNVNTGTVSATTGVVTNGSIAANTATIAQTVTAGNITTVGSVSAVGNVTGNFFIGNGRLLTGLSTYGNANVADFLQSYSGMLTADSISLSGDIIGNDVYMYGKVFATTIVSAVGNVSGGNLTTAGGVSALGNVRASYYFGDGRFLSNIQGNYNNANVAAFLPTYTGNLTANNISTTGNITGQYFFGNGSQLSGIRATEIGVLPDLSVTGNATIGNVNSAGNVTAAYFIGDGSQLTNLPATNYSNANVAAFLPTYTGNISANRISATGNITGNYFIGNGSQLTGMYGNTNVASYLPTYTGNLTVNVISASGNVTGRYFVGNGSLLTGIQATQVGVLPSLSVTGNTDTGVLNSLGRISAVGNIITPETVVAGNLIASGTARIDGNTQVGNLSAVGQVIASGNITAGATAYFVGNGRFLTGVVASGVAANALVGDTLSANVQYSSLRQVGALTNLSVTGNTTMAGVDVYSLAAQSDITAAGNVLGTALSATGNVYGQYILGNGSQLTGIQATVVGTLPSLSVTGNVSIGGYYIGDGGMLSNITVTTTYGNSNVAAYLPTYTGNLAGGNISVSGTITGNGVGIRSINGANVFGTVANANYAFFSGSASSANVAARVTANSQPNITSVGNLTSLTVTGNTQTANLTVSSNIQAGNITVTNNQTIGGNLSVVGNIFGNIQANFLVPGSNTQVLYNKNGAAAANAAFTFNEATSTLYVGGVVSAAGNITGNYILGNASLLSNVPSVLTVSNWFNGNIISNTIANVKALRFNGNTGITVEDLGNSEALVSLGSSFKTWEVDGQANLVAVGEDIVKFVAGPGIVITTNANAYPQEIAFAANVSNISNGTSNITIVNNSTIRAGVAGNQILEINANGISVTGNVTGNYILGNGRFLSGLPEAYSNANVAAYLPTYTGNLTADVVSTTGNITAPYFIGNGSQLTGVIASNVGTLGSLSVTGNVTAGGATFNGNVGIAGNLSVIGNINYINVTDLVVGDPLIYFAANNTGNLLDIGWVGSYDDGLYQHTGLVRDHTDGVWKLFSNVVAEPTTVIDWANAQYDQFLSGQITSTADISAAGNITGNVFIGNGAGLTNLVGANVTGTVANAGYAANANSATYAGTATTALTANTANTVTANAQPNITSVGTLTSLSVSGNINTTGNTTAAYFIGDGSQLTNINPGNITGLLGNSINLGSNSQGQLVSNAVNLTTSTSVTNGIALLNQVLGKLVPPAPPNFPNAVTLAVSSLSTYRMANFTQTDNTPGANKNVAGGTTVTTVRRAAAYSTNSIANVGPGDSGTVIAVLNGADAGNVTLTSALTGNGVYSNLVITNNYDYNRANANIAAGFWSVFTSQASGTVSQGWNEVRIADTATGNTNTPSWYYDASAPGTPSVGNLTITPSSTSLTYSSTVGHYNSTTQFSLGFTADKLSGDMYPTSDTFVTGTAGGAFGAPASVTYTAAGVTTPLARNLFVSSGAQSVTTTSNIISGFGASTTGPSVSVVNSYATGTGVFTTALGANVLYKTGTASTMEESNVVIGGTIGSGSGAAFRIVNPGSTDTPAYTGSEAAFNSTSGPLQTSDATIVAAVLKHDQTNYSTGYLPAGPDLSSGRSGAQYFTFKIMRSSVSKFDVKWTGTIAGLWVALPGSVIDSTSTLNGWLDMSVAYGGAGAPGANTGAGGNGSNGCALGGVAPLNSAQTNKSVTATFGTVSSTSATNNEIYIRIKLTSGQSVTALSLQPASN